MRSIRSTTSAALRARLTTTSASPLSRRLLLPTTAMLPLRGRACRLHRTALGSRSSAHAATATAGVPPPLAALATAGRGGSGGLDQWRHHPQLRAAPRRCFVAAASGDAVVVCETPEEHAEALATAGNKLVVHYFTAAWCGPCKAITPLYSELSSTHAADAVFLKIDVDDNEEVAMEYEVRMMPTFIFSRGGERLHEFAGADGNQLSSTVASLIEYPHRHTDRGRYKCAEHNSGLADIY